MKTHRPAVYSYTRFSDPRQSTGQSAERQTALAAEWAKARGLTLDASLSMHDEGLSAYHARHVKSGALGVFLAAVEAGRIAPGSILLVEQFDRLSRRTALDAQAQLTQIINAGITVVTTKDGKEYSRESLQANPYDLVMSVVLMIRAHEESESKSKRVTSAIRSQCERWQAGTYRGPIRNGKDPAWIRREGNAWMLIPERVAAIRAAIDCYRQGLGVVAVLRELQSRGLKLTENTQSATVYKMLKQRTLVGDKELTVDGQSFILDDYYPAVLTRAEWAELQAMMDQRAHAPQRAITTTGYVHVFTGMGILRCGYCGNAMSGHNISGRRRPDGSQPDYGRRMLCLGIASRGAAPCPVGGSRSIVPLERAIMSYCSDLMNLQALYGPDRAPGSRAKVTQARAAIATLEQQLERVTDALVAGGKEAPAAFIKRAKGLEEKIAQEQRTLAAAERELAAATRHGVTSLEEKWRALAAGVEAQDHDARMKARQLLGDTFERIDVYHSGVNPKRTPPGSMDIVLLAKGGVERILRIDAQGNWITTEQTNHRRELTA